MITELIRENIRKLKPYSSARDEFKAAASIYLDANENAYRVLPNENINRYPDPHQVKLKEAIADLKGTESSQIFLGNGSDEIIDLAYRIFCEPGRDNVIVCVPTYGMYEVSAQINNIEVRKVLLKAEFQLDVAEVLRNADSNTRLLFLCSPNNPTGNLLDEEDIEELLSKFNGLVILDEAYIDFASQSSYTKKLQRYENLLVMQTLSKAWGLAGLRIGIAYGAPALIEWFQKVKPPYNINSKSQEMALLAIKNKALYEEYLQSLITGRQELFDKLSDFSFVKHIYPSEANFLLIKVSDANSLYGYLVQNGIVIRNRSKDPMLENCLRITVGTKEENSQLLKVLEDYSK